MTPDDMPAASDRFPPAGNGLRCSFTVDDASPLRRRSTFASDSEGPPRRSSNFSEYSLSDARELLNPQPEGASMAGSDTSSLASLSLAFALLPALVGVVHKNGSAMVTDMMLLGLAGVFLHWSVTQPWTWYHAAQEVRIQQEPSSEDVIEDDSETDAASSPLDNVPEDAETRSEPPRSKSSGKRSSRQQSALTELHVYEMLALLSCAMLPLLGAYLLHAIRSQLSRPSEGLVSNFNLTIFIGFAELRVFAHFWRLVQTRTVYLQRVVQGGGESGAMDKTEIIEQILSRLERIEARPMAERNQADPGPGASKQKQDASLIRDVRNAIQPDLDALNRAVRRYEKKATVLQAQTEGRFGTFERRLDDAIALAATAAKNSASQKNVLAWTVESLVTLALLPFRAVVSLVLLPFRSLFGLARKQNHRGPQTKSSRSRNGKAGQMHQTQPRYSGDRVPARVAKR